MTFSTEARSTLADRSLRSEVSRRPLKDLTANSKPGQKPCRVRKPELGSTHLHGARDQHQKFTQRRVGEHQLQPDQHRRVLLISKTLRDIPRFANRVLCPHGQQSSDASYSRVQLKTRGSRTWRLLGDPTLPSLSRASICQLRETILRDISVLYANGLSYTPDLTRLEIVSKRSKVRLPETIYRPLIDVFDFDLDAVGQTIIWTEPGKQMIRHVEAQFDVLEMLAVLSLSLSHQTIPVDLEPTCVAQVLREHRPPVQQQNLVIRHVKKYSAELGQLVIELTRDHLRRLPWRTSPPATPTRNATLDRCATVGHILDLINQSIKDDDGGTKNDGLLKDRAAILVVYASLLIHQHAKVVNVIASRGLLERSSKDTAESYISQDDFNSVVRARQMAHEALDELAMQRLELDEEMSWFIRADT